MQPCKAGPERNLPVYTDRIYIQTCMKMYSKRLLSHIDVYSLVQMMMQHQTSENQRYIQKQHRQNNCSLTLDILRKTSLSGGIKYQNRYNNAKVHND